MRPSRGPSQNKGQEDHALIAETALESESFGEEVEAGGDCADEGEAA